MSQSSAADALPDVPRYRSTTRISHSLLECLRSQIEDQLHIHACERFNSLLTSGAGSDPPEPMPFPPPTHVRYLTTLIVHPYYTTQTSKRNPYPREPVLAYRLLKRILAVVGPSGADLVRAWEFRRPKQASRRRAQEASAEGAGTADAADLTGELPNEESLFSLAEELWPVVGWAFTCAVLHKARWRWWKLVLDVVLDGMERDWQLRRRFAEETGDMDTLLESLVVRMLPDPVGSAGYRRVFRALLADGSRKSAQEFDTIFPDELRPRRKKRPNNNGGMSSYLGAEDTESELEAEVVEEDGEKKRDPSSMSQDPLPSESDDEMEDPSELVAPNAASAWGGMEAMELRQRFINLIVSVCSAKVWIPNLDFFHELHSNLLHVPLASLQLFTSPILPSTPDYIASLTQLLVESLIATAAISPDDQKLTDTVMLKFLSYPAHDTSLDSNARLAILLDVQLRLLAREGYLKWTPELQDAVEKGVKARRDKVNTSDKRRKRQPGTESLMQEQTKLFWTAAEGRIKGTTAVLKMKAQQEEKAKAKAKQEEEEEAKKA